jgi:hypothetical protein
MGAGGDLGLHSVEVGLRAQEAWVNEGLRSRGGNVSDADEKPGYSGHSAQAAEKAHEHVVANRYRQAMSRKYPEISILHDPFLLLYCNSDKQLN